jgi:hypothetical protein
MCAQQRLPPTRPLPAMSPLRWARLYSLLPLPMPGVHANKSTVASLAVVAHNVAHIDRDSFRSYTHACVATRFMGSNARANHDCRAYAVFSIHSMYKMHH